MIYVMNDYELIYLIRQHDQIAFSYLIDKYSRLIWKNVHLLELSKGDSEDFYQEGLMMLVKAVNTFNERYNKTFTRYFELILKRKFYALKRRLPDYVLYDNYSFQKGVTFIEEEAPDLSFRSEIERIVYEDYFIAGVPVPEIALSTGFDRKKIYNTIFRVRNKLKSML
ncbi:MAG: RNA polymerase sigma factor [Acholeplasmataceae bacterium]